MLPSACWSLLKVWKNDCPMKSNRLVDDSAGKKSYQRIDALDWSPSEQTMAKLCLHLIRQIDNLGCSLSESGFTGFKDFQDWNSI